MKKFNFKKGFTLIELLVVVAIIGILASVVLAALNSARSKGGDAGVKSNLRTVTSQSEIFWLNNSSYLPSGGIAITTPVTCPTYSASGVTMLAKDKVIADSIAQATSNGGNGNSCYNSASVWSVAVGLKTNTSISWCIDSTGSARQVAFAPSSAITVGTGLCK